MEIKLPTNLMLLVTTACILASGFIFCGPDMKDDGIPLLPRDYSEKSTDLKGDIAVMWEEHGAGWSSDRAVDAAVRVFNTVELRGRSREESVATLGDPATRIPFFPTTCPGTLAYCFDNGAWGWQFNIHFAENRAVSIERLGIQ